MRKVRTGCFLDSIPTITTALYLVYFCKSRQTYRLVRMVIQCIAGIPSIVLGLFAYRYLVRDLNWGRCVLSAGSALAIMGLPKMCLPILIGKKPGHFWEEGWDRTLYYTRL